MTNKRKNNKKKVIITVAIVVALLLVGGGVVLMTLPKDTAPVETVAIADTQAPLAAPAAIVEADEPETAVIADTQAPLAAPAAIAEQQDEPEATDNEDEADEAPVVFDPTIVPVPPTTTQEPTEAGPTEEELREQELKALTERSIEWLKGQLSDKDSLVYKYFVTGNRLNNELDSNGVNYGQIISDSLRGDVTGHDANSVFAWLMVSHNNTADAANTDYDIFWTNEDLSQIAAGDKIDDVTKYETENDTFTEGSAEKEVKVMPDGIKESYDTIDPDSFVADPVAGTPTNI